MCSAQQDEAMKVAAIARRRGRPMNLLFFASVVSVAGMRNSGAVALTQLKLLFHNSPGGKTPATGVAAAGVARLPYDVPRAALNHLRRPAKERGRRSSVLAKSSSSSASTSSSSSSLSAEEIVTVIGETETEETIKKSRFIGRCGPAATFEEGKALLARILKEHPKARHSCWAWRGLGDEHRFSDDGEPGGTAGQPILGGIESEGVSEVMVVVTRYSGGIKLGTGGLCRAYGGGSRLCLQAAERETRTPMRRLRVTAPVESVGDVYHAVSGSKRLSEEFTADGSIVLRVAVELGQVEEVRGRLQDATKGAAQIEEEDEDERSPAD